MRGAPLVLTLLLTAPVMAGCLWPGDDSEEGTNHVPADLVILEPDLFALPPNEIASTAVLATIVNNQKAWEGRVAYPPLAAVRLVDVGQGGHGHDHGIDVDVDH